MDVGTGDRRGGRQYLDRSTPSVQGGGRKVPEAPTPVPPLRTNEGIDGVESQRVNLREVTLGLWESHEGGGRLRNRSGSRRVPSVLRLGEGLPPVSQRVEACVARFPDPTPPETDVGPGDNPSPNNRPGERVCTRKVGD